MFKYIKWELINETKSKIVLLGCVAAVYLLVLVLPSNVDNIFTTFIYFAFTIILSGTAILSFIYGAKRTMDSYKNQTFLLESMIPLSPSKILLAKYILAIIFDIMFSVIFTLGVATALSKANINLLDTMLTSFLNSDFDTKTAIFRVFILMISSTIAFTSFITLLFIGLKSFFPNGKGLKIISYIFGTFLLSTFVGKISEFFLEGQNVDLIYSLIMILITSACYFVSVWFIKNKLEVYN